MSAPLVLNDGPWRSGCEKCGAQCGPNLKIVNGRCNICGCRDREHGVPFLTSVPVVSYCPVTLDAIGEACVRSVVKP